MKEENNRRGLRGLKSSSGRSLSRVVGVTIIINKLMLRDFEASRLRGKGFVSYLHIHSI